MQIKPIHIVKKLKENNLNVSKTSRDLGICRSTVYRWKYKATSTNGYNTFIRTINLKRTSTRPKHIEYILNSDQKIDIITLRKSTGYGSKKIKKILNLNVHHKTIYRFLKSKGLVNVKPKYRRPRFQNTKHMHLKNTKTLGYLQMDVKYITPELSSLPWTCFQFAVIDIYSRYKEAVILNQCDSDGAVLALIEILPKLPFKPVFIQTDNGFEFQGKFLKYLSDINLEHHFIHKSTPNENAVIERSFRTDEEEFFFRLEKPFKDYDDLRAQFADYLHRYNTFRPHLGLDLKTPMEVVANVMSP